MQRVAAHGETIMTSAEIPCLAVLVLDPQDRIVEMNAAALELTQSSLAASVGQPVGAVLPALADVAPLGGQAEEMPRDIIVSSNGRQDCFEVRVTRLAGESSDAPGHVIILQAAAEHGRMKSQLREGEDLYRVTLDTMLEGCQIIDSEWRYVYVNDAAARQGRRSKEQLLGHKLTDVYPGVETAALFAVLQRCMVERTPQHLENEFVYPDGGRGWFDVSILPAPEGILVLSIDITARKQAETLLRQSVQSTSRQLEQETAERKQAEAAAEAERKRLHEVLEMLPAYVVLLAADFHVPFANRFFRERFGDADGRRCYEYLFSRTEACENCESFKALYNVAPPRWEWTGPDGRDYDIYDFPFTDADGSLLVMEMGIDITERKHAEAALQQANETLERRVAERTAELTASEERLRQSAARLQAQNAELEAFGHTVAHDLKNPLTTVLGYAQSMARSTTLAANPRWEKAVHNIAASAQRMRRIIDALLLLAAARDEDVPHEPLDMVGIVTEAQARLGEDIAELEAELTVPRRWPKAVGYTPWVEEVWINLLSNALRYGGRPPHIELGAAIVPGGQARFWVRDDGPGLAPEARAELFTPFTRLHQIGSGGHGLGLSIVQRIVEKLGGSVGVESEAGQGSVFYFTLPLATRSGDVPPR
jgi:PAS domain S-box-containing protein